MIKGHGEIVWTDAGGSAGIKFSSISGCGHNDFVEWLDRNEVLQR